MRFVLTVAVFASLAAPAWADTGDARKALAKCVEIADGAERLKCFDAAVPPLLAQPEPQAQTQAQEDSGGVLAWFGFEKPVTKTEDFGRPPPSPERPPEITSLTAGVLEFAKNAHGKSLFVLDNGQVWRQLDGDTTEVRDPRRGETMKVLIETGMLGSYNLKVEGQRGYVKVRRVK